MSKDMQKEKPKAGINKWNYSGSVVKKNAKFSGNGNMYASIMIKIPAKNPKYSTTLWIKAFKEKATEIEETVKEGANYSFWGYVSNSKYEQNGETKWSTDFIINGFTEADEADAAPVVDETKGEEPPF